MLTSLHPPCTCASCMLPLSLFPKQPRRRLSLAYRFPISNILSPKDLCLHENQLTSISRQAMTSAYRRGVVLGTAAYIIWGTSAIYWKQLVKVPAMQLLCHRVVWAFPIALLATVSSQHREHLPSLLARSHLAFYLLTATLLGINLFVSIWAANAGFIVELSLGYFTSPLVSVLLGVLCLREHLRFWQWFAVSLALAGLATVTFLYGKFPWIAIVLALDFGFYALLQKKSTLPSVVGITMEMFYLSLPAAIYLIILESQGTAAFGRMSVGYDFLLVGLGVLTILPQLFFSTAVKCIPLTVMGLLQFIGPTLNILTGIVIYREPFETSKAIGFSLVWLGLIIYTWDIFRAARSTPLHVQVIQDAEDDADTPQNSRAYAPIDS